MEPKPSDSNWRNYFRVNLREAVKSNPSPSFEYNDYYRDGLEYLFNYIDTLESQRDCAVETLEEIARGICHTATIAEEVAQQALQDIEEESK